MDKIDLLLSGKERYFCHRCEGQKAYIIKSFYEDNDKIEVYYCPECNNEWSNDEEHC